MQHIVKTQIDEIVKDDFFSKKIRTLLQQRYSAMHYRCNHGQDQIRMKAYQGLELVSREEFYIWAICQEQFWVLIFAWRDGGFKKMDTPSIDRRDSMLGYTISNMRWLGWGKHLKLSGHVGARLKKNKTGFIGVHFRKDRPISPYHAYYKYNNKIHTVGHYKTAEEAAQHRDVVMKTLYGEDASLAFT